VGYIKELAETANSKKALSSALPCDMEESLIKKLSALAKCMQNKTEQLDIALLKTADYSDPAQLAVYYHDTIIALMNELRAAADELETNTSSKYWPFPTYGDLLFSV
jgi:glutamine synthetase